MVAKGKEPASPAKPKPLGAKSPAAKGKTSASPLGSPTPSQRSRARALVVKTEGDESEVGIAATSKPKNAKSPAKAAGGGNTGAGAEDTPTSPRGTPRRGAACKARLQMTAAATKDGDGDAAFDDDGDEFDIKAEDAPMEEDDEFDGEASPKKAKPRGPRSKPGTPRSRYAPLPPVLTLSLVQTRAPRAKNILSGAPCLLVSHYLP